MFPSVHAPRPPVDLQPLKSKDVSVKPWRVQIRASNRGSLRQGLMEDSVLCMCEQCVAAAR